MQLFDRNGTPVEVPEDKVPEALSSGHLGLPAGTSIPVRLADGQTGTVPVEHATGAFAAGAQVLSAKAALQAKYEAKYGGAGVEIAAGLEGAARGASLGLSDKAALAAAGLFGGHEAEEAVRQHLQGVQAANPILSTVAEIGGAVAPALLSDGSSAASEAGEGASLLSRAGRLLSAPSEAVTGLGNVVERGVVKLVGKEGTSLATRVLQRAAAVGARGVAEGAIVGGTQAADESVLGDTELTGQKLLSAVGHGALLGGVGGAVLGAGGQVGIEALGKASTAISSLADGQMFRALNPERRFVKLAEHIPGGADGIGRRMLDDGVAKAGDGIEEIAQKVAAKRDEYGAEVGQILRQADDAGFAGPKVGNVLDEIVKANGVVDRLSALPSLNAGAISKVRGVVEDIAAQAGVPTVEAAEAAGLSRGARAAMIDDARLSFKGAQELRARIDDAIKWSAPAAGAPANEVNDALKGVRAALENEIEGAGDAASKKLGGTFLKDYQAAKLGYRQYSVADLAAQNAVAARTANRVVSPSDYGVGIGGLAGGLASGHPLTAALGLAGGIAHHVIRERGNTLAALALDRVSAIGGIQRATMAVDREIDRGVARVAGSTDRVLPQLKASTSAELSSFARRAKAVASAASDAEAHIANVANAVSPLSQAAPNVVNAFQRAAIRASTFLARAIPQPPPQGLIPSHEKYEPSDTEKQAFNEKYEAVNDPASVLSHTHDGTVTPNEVTALRTVHPELYQEMSQKLIAELQKSKEGVPYDRQIAISTFLGQPTSPELSAAMIQAFQASYASAPPPQGAPAGGKGHKGGGAPKRKISLAGNAALQGQSKL